MQVSLYRRTHLRQDIFLGDVSIPLSEVDDTGNSAQTSELRRYTLARRSVKDKVRMLLLWIFFCMHLSQSKQKCPSLDIWVVDLKLCTSGAIPLLLQVRGEINLACCWRVTPQDVLTLRVRNLAAEVSQREEMLAVLAERTGQEAAESSNPELPASSNLKVQWPASLLPAQLKMARTSRGRLGVKVPSLSCPPLPQNSAVTAISAPIARTLLKESRSRC